MNNKYLDRSSLNILLISLQADNCYFSQDKKEKNFTLPPLGMLYISSFLKQHGYTNIDFIELGMEKESQDLFQEKVKQKKPVLIGISVYAETHQTAINLSRYIKKIQPDCKIVFGNAQATFTAESLLKDSGGDYVCLGESESTMVELLEHISCGFPQLYDIKGIVWKNDDSIIRNKIRGRIQTLDAIPLPDRKIIGDNIAHYSQKSSIITSRGCPGRCIFCCSRSFWGNKVSLRSAENIFSEIIYLYYTNLMDKDEKWGGWFNIMDDTFTLNKSRLSKFCIYLKKANLKLKWHCASRLDFLTEPMLKEMRQAGCIHLQIGVESAVPHILRSINKYIEIEHLPLAMQNMKELGILVALTFIIGLPDDTIETLKYTLEYAKKIWIEYDNIEFIGIAYLTPFPGTDYFNNPQKYGLKWEVNSYKQLSMYRPVVSTKNLSVSDLTKAFHDFHNFSQRRMIELQGLGSNAPYIKHL